MPKTLYATLVDMDDLEILGRRWFFHLPCVGDEMKLVGDRYFTVTGVVWHIDEDESKHHDRVHIALKRSS